MDDKKVREVYSDVDRLLKQFSEKLSSFNEDTEDFFVVRKNFLRNVGKKSDGSENSFSKKIMFSNAPFANEEFILAEKKKW